MNDNNERILIKNKKKSHLLIALWFLLSCTLGPSLLSEIIVIPPFKVVFIILYCLIISRILSGKIKLETLNRNIYGKIIILGFAIYNVGLLIAAVDNANSNDYLPAVIGSLLLLVTLLVASVTITEEIFTECMNFYCVFISILAAFSILVFSAIVFAHVPPVNEFISPEGRVYQNYVIAFVEASMDTIDIKRAGSFYDEPGTFAMFLAPAILWTVIVTPSTLMISILLVAFLLTFSIGGWAALGISIIYVMMIAPSIIKSYGRAVSIAIWLVAIVICMSCLLNILDLTWIIKYIENKFSGNELTFTGNAIDNISSVDLRRNEIDDFLKALFDKPVGYGVKSDRIIGKFSVGVMAVSLQGGVLGVTGYFVAFCGILIGLIQHFRCNRNNLRLGHNSLSNNVVSILAINLSLVVMSFQRIDLLHCYAGIFMCSFMIVCPMQISRKTVNRKSDYRT